MPAVDTLTVRTSLAEQFSDQRFRRVIDTCVQVETREGRLPDIGFMTNSMEGALRAAEAYYVSPDMAEFATMASEDFPLDETILKEDQPSEFGFMYLPSRLRFLELRGRLQVVHAVLWVNQRIWCLTDRSDPDDEISNELRRAYPDANEWWGRWDVNGMIYFNYGKPIPKILTFSKGVLPPSAKVEFNRGPDGEIMMYTDHVVDIKAGEEPTSQPDPVLRFLLAVWRLMQQNLASLHTEDEPARPFRRRAERVHQPTKVTVISLRRREGHHEGTGESINYRTIVRGHWRRVWCGKKDGERYQRAVYVHPFWRGPEGAPIIIRQRVNALIR